LTIAPYLFYTKRQVNVVKQRHIRPIAICVFRRADLIFVFEGRDSVKNEVYYRPLGGAIEFGERGIQTVEREIMEEIGEQVENLKPLSAIESLFTYEGQPHHEIVLVFEADFADGAVYQRASVNGNESDGAPFTVMWKPLSDFRDGKAILYPEGLLELLDTKEAR